MRLKAKRSASGSNHRSRARRGVLSLALAATALIALAFAASAQAITYSGAGTPLAQPAGERAGSVAVDQSTGDLYVSSSGTISPAIGPDGTVQRFSSAGSEESCALSPVPQHPGGIAVDPSTGEVKLVNLGVSPAAGEMLTFPQGCGAEAAVNSGTADTTEGSAELTSVSTAHPLQVGQGISGPGIPTATATGELTTGSAEITGLSGVSGTFALGQVVTGSGVPAGATVVFCAPSCAAPTFIELSAAVSGASVSGAHITARTTVTAASGSTATLSNPAEATGTGVAISATAWDLEISGATIAQPAIDGSGDIIWPDAQNGALRKLAPWGEELTEGSFPVTSGVKNAHSAALDAQGDIFLTNTGEESGTCGSSAPFRLKKLQPDGSNYSEGEAGVTGSESVFAGLTEAATTVAVDKSTGNVYVGLGCQHRTGHSSRSTSTAPAAANWPKGSPRGRNSKTPPAPRARASTSSRSTKKPKPSTPPTAATKWSRSSKTPRPRKRSDHVVTSGEPARSAVQHDRQRLPVRIRRRPGSDRRSNRRKLRRMERQAPAPLKPATAPRKRAARSRSKPTARSTPNSARAPPNSP